MPDLANFNYAVRYTHMSVLRQYMGLPTAELDYVRHQTGIPTVYTAFSTGIPDFDIKMNGGPGMYMMYLLMHMKRYGNISNSEFQDFFWFANSTMEEMQRG